MDIVIDTSAIIAVIVAEPEKSKIVEITLSKSLIAPGSIPWEVGNAFSAMFKQDRITLEDARKGLSIFESIPIRYIDPDFENALKIAKAVNIYAYDAYFLDCAQRCKAKLLTLDKKLQNAALSSNVELVEM